MFAQVCLPRISRVSQMWNRNRWKQCNIRRRYFAILISLCTLATNNCTDLFYSFFSSSTYFLGERHGFNGQLNDTTKHFTYFAPRDYAWNVAAVSSPSTSKKIFMPEFSYHVSIRETAKFRRNKSSFRIIPIRRRLEASCYGIFNLKNRSLI